MEPCAPTSSTLSPEWATGRLSSTTSTTSTSSTSSTTFSSPASSSSGAVAPGAPSCGGGSPLPAQEPAERAEAAKADKEMAMGMAVGMEEEEEEARHHTHAQEEPDPRRELVDLLNKIFEMDGQQHEARRARLDKDALLRKAAGKLEATRDVSWADMHQAEAWLAFLFGENLEDFHGESMAAAGGRHEERRRKMASILAPFATLRSDPRSLAAGSSSATPAERSEVRLRLCKALGRPFEQLSDDLRAAEEILAARAESAVLAAFKPSQALATTSSAAVATLAAAGNSASVALASGEGLPSSTPSSSSASPSSSGTHATGAGSAAPVRRKDRERSEETIPLAGSAGNTSSGFVGKLRHTHRRARSIGDFATSTIMKRRKDEAEGEEEAGISPNSSSSALPTAATEEPNLSEVKNVEKFFILYGMDGVVALKNLLNEVRKEREEPSIAGSLRSPSPSNPSNEREKIERKERIESFLSRRTSRADQSGPLPGAGSDSPESLTPREKIEGSGETESTANILKSIFRPTKRSVSRSALADAAAEEEDDGPAIEPKYIEDAKDFEFQTDNPPLLMPVFGYRVELGLPMLEEERRHLCDLERCRLQRSAEDIAYYREYFYGVEHTNFLGWDATLGAVAVSVEDYKTRDREDELTAKALVLIRTKKLTARTVLPLSSSSKETIKLLKAQEPMLANTKLVKVKEPQLVQDLLEMERKLLVKNYKFGVLYVKEGQDQENDMFSNTEASPSFEDFLNFLGDRIQLQGWKGFRGGLDVNKNSTGTHSVHTKFRGFEIMFHVSTLLPYSVDDEQQLERKRHLGNDIVVIIFVDGKTPFSPDVLHSEFNHSFVVVQPCYDEQKAEAVENGDTGRTRSKRYYKIAFGDKVGVRAYGPPLPEPSVFENDDNFRYYFLTKLLNAERAALHAPNFRIKLQRTRLLILKDLLSKYCKKEMSSLDSFTG